jgi:hypothetical protein
VAFHAADRSNPVRFATAKYFKRGQVPWAN